MKYLGILVMVAFVLTSCFDDPGTEILLEESFVEFDVASEPSQSESFSYLRANDGVLKPAGFLVNRVDADATNAVNVTWGVDQASTAIEGLHYVINSTTVTIPAGEYSAAVDIDIDADNIEAGENLRLILEIVSADLPIAPELDSAVHVISVTCPVEDDFLVGDYLITQTTPFADGVSPSLSSGSVVTVETVTGSETGRTFLTENYPAYAAPCNGNFVPFRFDVVCGSIVAGTVTSTCPCAGPFLFGPATTSFVLPDLTDDSEFELTFTDDVTGDCGAPVQTTYTFVKQ
ncbi:MAG: hypothetical protein WBA74_22620 [Cyclobacteriaceae bacterium]